jgi:uncharacterized damage-inducible protein DinB
MTSLPYSQLVAYKQWADRCLCDVVRDVLPQLAAQDSAIMLQILDHIHVVDRIFQHHLRGLPHGFKAARSEQLPQFDALWASMQEADAWYVGYVGALTDGEFDEPIDFTFTSGKPARMRRSEILLHVCLHGQYHRGNAGALLQLRGFAPPRDGFTDFLERNAASSIREPG